MMGGWYGGWPGLGWIGMVLMPVVWIGALALIVWAVAQFVPTRAKNDGDSTLEILKRRYASGEISQAEFEQSREALGPDHYARARDSNGPVI